MPVPILHSVRLSVQQRARQLHARLQEALRSSFLWFVASATGTRAAKTDYYLFCFSSAIDVKSLISVYARQKQWSHDYVYKIHDFSLENQLILIKLTMKIKDLGAHPAAFRAKVPKNQLNSGEKLV